MARGDLPDIQHKARVTGLDGIGVVSSRSLAAAGQAAGGGMETAEAAARVFSGLSSKIGQLADRAAVKEGETEGALAGLDPEFRPRGDVSLYSQAYDHAGIEVFKSRMTVELSNQVQALEEKHRADPGGLDKALGALREGWSRRLFDEVRPDFEQRFATARASAVRGATREWRDQRRAEQSAALQDELGVRLRTLHQQAYKLGLDEGADAVLAAEVGALKQRIGMRGVDGAPLIAPGNQRKLLEGAAKETTTARLLGALERTDGLEAKARFIQGFQDDFAHSRGLAALYDYSEFETVSHKLEAQYSRARAVSEAGARGVGEMLTSIERRAEQGFAPRPAELAEVEAKVRASSDPAKAARLDEAKATLEWQQWARLQPPAVLDQVLTRERDRLTERQGASAGEVARLQLGERLLDTMRSELKQDPLGWADRVGLVRVPPLDLSSPDAAEVSVRARLATADQVAAEYGVPAQYLRPDEKRRLATAAAQGGEATIAISEALTRAAGDRAPKMLAELFDEAPTVAVLGGHVARVGVTPAARDAADGLALAKTDGFKPVAPQAKLAREEAAAEIGPALAALPKSEQAVIAMTNAAYEVRARRLGLTEFDGELWRKTLRESLGERQVGGDTYGGVVWQGAGYVSRGSRPVVIPPDVKQDGFAELIEAIRLDDLVAAGGAPLHGDGSPASLASVRRASLVSAGDARYLLALGDPADDPQWLMDGRGEPYVLDLARLAPALRKRRPDLYLGGR